MSLSEWHEQVAPYLRAIEEISLQLDIRCTWLMDALGNLPARPAWPTKAEDALERAETALALALTAVKQVRTNYRAKPVLRYENFTMPKRSTR